MNDHMSRRRFLTATFPQQSGLLRRLGFLTVIVALSVTAAAQPAGKPFLSSHPTKVERGGTYSVTVRVAQAPEMQWSLDLNGTQIASGFTDDEFKDTTSIKIPTNIAEGKATLTLKTFGTLPGGGIPPQVTKVAILVDDDPATRLPPDLQLAGSLGNKTIKSTGSLPVTVLNYSLSPSVTYTVLLLSGRSEIGRGTVSKTTRQATVQYALDDTVFTEESEFSHSLTAVLIAGNTEVLSRTTSVNVTPRRQLPVAVTFLTTDFLLNAGTDTVQYYIEPTEPVLGPAGRILQASFVKWESAEVVRTDRVVLLPTKSTSSFSVPSTASIGLYHVILFWPGDSTYAPFISWPYPFGVVGR